MSQREPPRKGRVLRAVCQEASEDHLGVALIRSVDYVIIMSGSHIMGRQAGWNRVDTSHALRRL